MNALQTLIDHKAAATVLFGWFIRECHQWWPDIVNAWPYISTHGGIGGIIKTLFVGNPNQVQLAVPPTLKDQLENLTLVKPEPKP